MKVYNTIIILQAWARGGAKCTDSPKCSQQETAQGNRRQNPGNSVCVRGQHPRGWVSNSDPWFIESSLQRNQQKAENCWWDGEEDRAVSSWLQARRWTRVGAVLLHHRSAKHWPHVPVLSRVVRQPVPYIHRWKVSYVDTLIIIIIAHCMYPISNDHGHLEFLQIMSYNDVIYLTSIMNLITTCTSLIGTTEQCRLVGNVWYNFKFFLLQIAREKGINSKYWISYLPDLLFSVPSLSTLSVVFATWQITSPTTSTATSAGHSSRKTNCSSLSCSAATCSRTWIIISDLILGILLWVEI
jgi:hypothetical protein